MMTGKGTSARYSSRHSLSSASTGTWKPKRRGVPAPKPQSAVGVLGTVRRWHDRHGFRLAPVERVKRILDDLTRRFVEKYGHEPLIPSRKEPYSHAGVAALFAVSAGSTIGGRTLKWHDPVSALGASALRLPDTRASARVRPVRRSTLGGIFFLIDHLLRGAKTP